MDRDDLDGRRIDKVLFEALRNCLDIKRVTLVPELSIGSTDPETYEAEWDWDSFDAFMRGKARLWMDVLIHDTTGRWAIWMDPDTTVFGTETALAEVLDEFMAKSNSGLLSLSEQYYPGSKAEWQPHFREYFYAVVRGAAT